jgi:hypothetical protein
MDRPRGHHSRSRSPRRNADRGPLPPLPPPPWWPQPQPPPPPPGVLMVATMCPYHPPPRPPPPQLLPTLKTHAAPPQLRPQQPQQPLPPPQVWTAAAPTFFPPLFPPPPPAQSAPALAEVARLYQTMPPPPNYPRLADLRPHVGPPSPPPSVARQQPPRSPPVARPAATASAAAAATSDTTARAVPLGGLQWPSSSSAPQRDSSAASSSAPLQAVQELRNLNNSLRVCLGALGSAFGVEPATRCDSPAAAPSVIAMAPLTPPRQFFQWPATFEEACRERRSYTPHMQRTEERPIAYCTCLHAQQLQYCPSYFEFLQLPMPICAVIVYAC